MCHHHLMKTFRFLFLVVMVAGLSSCNSSSTAGTTSTIATADCSKSAIEAAVGEATDIFNCSGNWAAIQPNSYVGECNDCESVWLYKWESGAWNLKGVGNQYASLTPNSGFLGMTGLLREKLYTDAMTEYPSQEVACELWPTNRYPENIAETGCTPDSSD